MWKCVVQDAHPRCSLTEEREGKMHTVQSMKGPSPSQEEKSWRLEIRWGVNCFFSRRSWRHQSPTPMFAQGIFSQESQWITCMNVAVSNKICKSWGDLFFCVVIWHTHVHVRVVLLPFWNWINSTRQKKNLQSLWNYVGKSCECKSAHSLQKFLCVSTISPIWWWRELQPTALYRLGAL